MIYLVATEMRSTRVIFSVHGTFHIRSRSPSKTSKKLDTMIIGLTLAAWGIISLFFFAIFGAVAK